MNQLDITSKEISSLSEMDSLFTTYCKNNGIYLDMTKSKEYDVYIDQETGSAYEWFIRGVFHCIGDEYLKKLVVD